MLRNGCRVRGGYTLVEVLVVVAIIALLIGILLPALTRAREHARQAVCAAHLSQLGKAEHVYQSQNAGWIPGSPLTTGYFFATWHDPWSPASPHRYNRFAISFYDYATSLRAVMSGPSSIRAPRDDADADAARAQLLREGVQGVFNCPSFAETLRPVAIGLDVPTSVSNHWKPLAGPSYFTMWTLVRGGGRVYGQAPRMYPAASREDVGQDPRWEVAVPPDYMPRHTKLGSESLKVFLADGLRYYDASLNSNLTYNIQMRGSKLATSATPPPVAGVTSGREYTGASAYSYRHGDRDQIQAAFFDAHVEALRVTGHKVPRRRLNSARFAGQAVHPKYYYPGKSLINNPEALHHPSGRELPTGLVLP